MRAVWRRQSDRSLRADWAGPPVLISRQALAATGLLQLGSRAEYRYRVRTGGIAGSLAQLVGFFPTRDWEVCRLSRPLVDAWAKVLDQVASGLLLIGFSALFIGGLGVFNSVHAYLQGKLATIALLKSIGLRDRRIAWVDLLQTDARWRRQRGGRPGRRPAGAGWGGGICGAFSHRADAWRVLRHPWHRRGCSASSPPSASLCRPWGAHCPCPRRSFSVVSMARRPAPESATGCLPRRPVPALPC